MKAHIQWLKEEDGQIGVFRCGEGFDEFSDPYEMVSTIQRLPDGGAHMFGVQSNMRPTQLFKFKKEIEKLMRQEGVSYIIWEKLLRDKKTMKKVKINIKNDINGRD